MYTYEIIPGLSDEQRFWFVVVVLALNLGAIVFLIYQPAKHKEVFKKLPAALFFLVPVAFIFAYNSLPHEPADNFSSFHAAEASYKEDIHKAEATEVKGVVFEAQENDNPMAADIRHGSMKVHTLDGILDCDAQSEPGRVFVVCEDGRTLRHIAKFNEKATTSAVSALRKAGLDFTEKVDYKIAAGRVDRVPAVVNGKIVMCDVKLNTTTTAQATCLNDRTEVSWR